MVQITVASFISNAIKESGKTQRQIASEIGYTKPNMITMLKHGHTPLPLDKVGPLSAALEVDPLHLFKLVMGEYHPNTLASLQPILKGLELSEEELSIIESYRIVKQLHPRPDSRKKLMQKAVKE